MSYQISKDFAFSASHVLHGLPEGHPCGRLHGHNYVVRVTVEADLLDAVGFVRDFGDLVPIGLYIDNTLDHRHLNDVMGDNPTSEHLAALIYGAAQAQVGGIAEVAVSETPKTWARYRP